MMANLNDVLVAIREKCMDCSGNQRKLVEECLIPTCPLYPYRSIKAMDQKPVKAKSKKQGQTQMTMFE